MNPVSWMENTWADLRHGAQLLRLNFTFAQWDEIRHRQQTFSGVFAWGDHRFNLAQAGEVRPAEGLWVSGDFFATFVKPVVGRLISSDTIIPDAAPRLW